MTGLDLLDSEVEEDLRATVRKLLADRCDPTAVVAAYDGDTSLHTGLWKALAADLGLAGLLVPEVHGGAGASAREAAVVLEELGRAVAPAPFLTSSVVATTILMASGPSGVHLAALSAGDRTAALVLPLSAGPLGEWPVPVRVRADRVHGRTTSVAGAVDADLLLVPVGTDRGIAVYAVPADEAQVVPVCSLDMTRQLADVTLDGARGDLLIPASAGADAVRDGLLVGAALLASEQLGVAQWCLATTVSYLKERRQFGRVVGGFQSLKHRLADLYVAVETAAAAARYAAVAVATGEDDRAVAASLAQAWCSDVAVRAAEEAIQLHGGIGMTWEHPAHLYLKRAKSQQLTFGTAGAHRHALADRVGLPG